MDLIPLLVAFGALVVLFLVYQAHSDGLKRFPGPRLSKWTDLSLLWTVYKTRHDEPFIKLHEKYGRIVRVGPNKLFFSDPEAVRQIHSATWNLRKSEMYPVLAATAQGETVLNFFSSTDIAYHDAIRKAAYRAFANTQIHEPAVDSVVSELLDVIRTKFAGVRGPDGLVDIGKWMDFFALDAISKIVYSAPYGFIKTGADVHGWMELNSSFGKYCAYVGEAPWLDKLFKKNPVLLWLQKHGYIDTSTKLVSLAMQTQAERLQAVKNEANFEPSHGDLLDEFIKIKFEKPDLVNDMEILKLGMAVVLAGGDTSAAYLAAFFCFLVKNVCVLQKLTAEIDATPIGLTFAEARRLPYLTACVLEAQRMFPVVRFTPQRVIPDQGAVVCGEHIPGGTVVGTPVWPLSRDKGVYGKDADVFRPERWLEAQPDSRRLMERTISIFGFGKYECPGKHITTVEVYKLVPALLREFKIEHANPQEEWTLSDGIFALPSNVKVRFSSRD